APLSPHDERERAQADDEDETDLHVQARARLVRPDLAEALPRELGRLVGATAPALDTVAQLRGVGLPALAPDGDGNPHDSILERGGGRGEHAPPATACVSAPEPPPRRRSPPATAPRR